MIAEKKPTMKSTFFFTAEHKGEKIPFQIRVVREEDYDAMYLVFGHHESPQPWPRGIEVVTVLFNPPGYPTVRCVRKDGTPVHFLVKFDAPHPMIKHEPWQHLEIDITFEETRLQRSQETQEV